MTEPKHCDDYIHDHDAPMALRWFLFVNRLQAIDNALCARNGVKPALFAKLDGRWVRVVMASRMGDVGVNENFSAQGYTRRVAVEQLTDFTDKRPKGGAR